jgi:DNA repair protein SbcD/Mre11
MRVLHTSDWHIGRTFHGHSTVGALRVVLEGLVDLVRERAVDVVLVSGDVFDSAMPAAEHYTLLTDILVGLRGTGAEVVVTSGNHDSAARLGFQSPFLSLSGVHVITGPEQYLEPVVVEGVAFYGIPYLEPSLFRHRHPEAELRRHDDVLAFVMERIRADAAARGGPYVVLSHCFVTGGAGGASVSGVASPLERDITAGGLDYVALDRFRGPDYVALGHIHGRAVLADGIRYSGAPLHYSFGEAGKPRGAWLVELDEQGLGEVIWVDLPVPRRLTVLTGTLEELLADPSNAEYEGDWISAILTDAVRPLDAMAKLQKRFPWCATIEHRPSERAEGGERRYAARVRAKSDPEIVAEFLAHVRNGMGPSATEAERIGEAFAALDADAGR